MRSSVTQSIRGDARGKRRKMRTSPEGRMEKGLGKKKKKKANEKTELGRGDEHSVQRSLSEKK